QAKPSFSSRILRRWGTAGRLPAAALMANVRKTGTGSCLGDSTKRFDRRDEVVRAREWPRVPRQRVRSAAARPGHALQHAGQALLLCAEAHEHRPVVGDGAVGHVAAEDLPEAVLIGARDVGVVGLVLELDAV